MIINKTFKHKIHQTKILQRKQSGKETNGSHKISNCSRACSCCFFKLWQWANCFFLFFGHVVCGMLVLWPGVKPKHPAVEARSPCHRTAREFPSHSFFFFNFLWNLVPWAGIEPGPPAPGAWSLSHWATREVPSHSFLNVTICNTLVLLYLCNYLNFLMKN